MQQVTLPQKPKIIKSEKNRAQFEIEGCYPGYGMTLGNALRRVLLSSLPGAAITGVKIKGVSHEFSTIPHVMEDVVEIILNLKQVRLKVHSEEPVKLKLKAKGEKEITADFIKTPSNVEIINKDAHIATLTHKKAELEMEMEAERGLGYEPVEQRKKEELEIGMISLDAIFTPVRKVNYEVENMRVGQRTDYNRLRIDIETDGTITPEDAFKEAVKILIDHFKMLLKPEKKVKEKPARPKKEEVLKKKIKKPEKPKDVSKTKVEELTLSTRTANALIEGGIKTIGGIIRKNEEELKSLSGLGEKGVKEIKRVIGRLGFTLKRTPEAR